MAALKKKFFEVEIPLTNSSVELLAYNIESLNKKTIKLDLTRQLRGKSIEVAFQTRLEKSKLIADPIRLSLMPFFIRRMLRKNISYVEDSFSIECKDGWLRIKPFLVTRKKVSRRVRKALRDETKSWLIDYSKDKKTKEIFSDIIGNRLQKSLSLKLKKIYPLALCEIRFLKIEKAKEQEEIKVTVEKISSLSTRENSEEFSGPQKAKLFAERDLGEKEQKEKAAEQTEVKEEKKEE